jgi:hypothetical protein
MPLLEKLFQIISKVVPESGALSEKESKLLLALNPQKFYVENVRSLLGVSYKSALQICETAVRQGVFERAVEVRCPDGSVAATAEMEAELPKEVRCWKDVDGFLEPEMTPSASLEKVFFYRLHEREAPLSRSA